MEIASLIVLYFVAGLGALKLIWNVGVPVDLFFRKRRGEEGGVSWMPYLEGVLWVLLVGLAAVLPGSAWISQPGNVALWGGAAIVLSHGLMFGFGMAAGWILARAERRKR